LIPLCQVWARHKLTFIARQCVTFFTHGTRSLEEKMSIGWKLHEGVLGPNDVVAPDERLS